MYSPMGTSFASLSVRMMSRIRHVLVCAGFLKGASMKRINLLVTVTLAVGIVLGLLGSRMVSAQDSLKSGTVLQRTELKGAPGWEAILVQRDLPPGVESGKHTQSGN